jgi:O-antigen/teichoic acid export membrane protein
MVYSWLWPALFCLMSLVFGITFPAVLVLIAASFLLAAAIGWGILARILASLPPGPARAPAPLLRPGLSLFTQELIQLLIASAPAIILGMVADNRQVGLFALAWRIALLINVVVAAVAGMAAPKFAELFALSDRAGLRRASAQAIALALAVAALPLAVMLIAPTPLLAMFGSAFGQGATTLRILALGQLAAAACTALPELLGMTAHLSSLRRINALALVVLLVATPPLASLFGAEGAAAATALTIAVNGGAAAWAVHRHLAIWPWQWPMARRRPGVTP